MMSTGGLRIENRLDWTSNFNPWEGENAVPIGCE